MMVSSSTICRNCCVFCPRDIQLVYGFLCVHHNTECMCKLVILLSEMVSRWKIYEPVGVSVCATFSRSNIVQAVVLEKLRSFVYVGQNRSLDCDIVYSTHDASHPPLFFSCSNIVSYGGSIPIIHTVFLERKFSVRFIKIYIKRMVPRTWLCAVVSKSIRILPQPS